MSKKALLIIDVQNYYINGYTRSMPLKIEKYIKQANFDYVLFAKFVNHKGSGFWNNLGWKKMCLSPDTDICKNLLPYAKKGTVFIKSTYSIFKSKSFLRYIKKNKIAELTLCGFDTDACVLASAYDGFDLGYKIIVKNDLTASHRGKTFTEYGLNIINGNIQSSQR